MWKKAGEWWQRASAGTKNSGRDLTGKGRYQTERGSTNWIPFASYCTTGQFGSLQQGFQRHCGPTAAVNVIRTLENLGQNRQSDRRGAAAAIPAQGRDPKAHEKELFLQCAQIGRREHIYWNSDILGRFGGTSNILTGIFLRSCLRAAGCADSVSVRFHPWITAEAVSRALDSGAIVYLQVYFHPRYKNHHMLCYACETEPGSGEPSFLLADGWQAGPVRVDAAGLGRGHFFTIRKKT